MMLGQKEACAASKAVKLALGDKAPAKVNGSRARGASQCRAPQKIVFGSQTKSRTPVPAHNGFQILVGMKGLGERHLHVAA
mmetsp:Transcript_7984/g.14158  ORF Transcript_7984/g.14158 Transcript_7984/m.14158 type:complete len:81 (+) Transcript_7984:207-449(+)